MEFEINNLPPMPRNRSHMIARSMSIKTPLAREFEKDLISRLKVSQDFQKIKLELDKNFDKFRHYLEVRYVIHTPETELFTKQGAISLHAVDTDAHKLMQDVIFKCLGQDDKIARETSFFTPVSKDGNWNYYISFKIMNKENLYV